MALVAYARVSSKDQDLQLQMQQLTDAGVDPEHIFCEKATGTTTKTAIRPEFERCMSFLRRDDVLVTTRFDRLSRSLRDHIAIMERLEEKGVKFRCLLQPEISTDTPQGRLVTGILAVCAQFETELRKERQREGIEAAKAKGVYMKNAERNSRMGYASRVLKAGATYGEAAQASGIPERTLRRRFPNYNQRTYPNRTTSKVPGIPGRFAIYSVNGPNEPTAADSDNATLPPSAAEAVEDTMGGQTPARKPGILSKLLG